jgi:ribosomal protein S18 acetylase RimI-like enzyme
LRSRIQVRAAKPADLDRVCELNRFVHDPHVTAHPDIFRPDPPFAEMRATFGAVIADESQSLMVAEVDGKCMGYAWAEIQRRDGQVFKLERERLYVHQISVDPVSRRSGVGRALLEEVAKMAELAGIKDLALDTWTFNTDAQAFFRALGFSQYNVKLWKRDHQ